MTFRAESSGIQDGSRELRVRRAYSMPVDPLSVATMPDYDISLLLFRTWFNYDEGRLALPGLIRSWSFDAKTGIYSFHVDPNAKWSSGNKITPDDLLANLKRAVRNDTSYGHAVESIVDLSSFKVTSVDKFQIKTKDGRPNEAFFQRLGSIFLAVAAPSDFPKDNVGKLMSNKVSGGPYVLKSSTEGLLEFVPNPLFNNARSNAPSKILIKKPEDDFEIMDFLNGKTWENLVQLTTILPPEAVKKVLSEKLPFWTRGHDRVSLLKPVGQGDLLKKRRRVLQAIAFYFSSFNFSPSELKVKKAESLQPVGYPLTQKLVYSKSQEKTPNSEIKILRPANYYGEFHEKILESVLQKAGVKAIWKSVPQKVYFKTASEDQTIDFVLLNFGVADPEPTTWMSLIFDQRMVDFDESDHEAFRKVSATGAREVEIGKYKNILESIAARGGYLPLFHFSTLAIARKGMSFKHLSELDETVDYSKVVFE